MIVQATATQLDPDITVFELSGRLTLGNTLLGIESQLKDLIKGGVRKLILDLKNLTYIDSAGIGVLMICAGEMEAAGGVVRAAGVGGLVAKVFDVVHFDRAVPVDPDVETAAKSF